MRVCASADGNRARRYPLQPRTRDGTRCRFLVLRSRYRRPVPALDVDIVIDNFDYERFLGPAIESALGQTYTSTRVTVVDDGSGDGSLAVAHSYGDRIGLIAKANGGQASALNAGAGATHGDLVAFLDADDVLRPDFAAAAVEAFRAHPEAIKVVFRAEVIDAAGNPTGRIEPSPHLALAQGDLRAATLGNAFDLVWPPLSAQVFRRSALTQILPIPEDEFRTLADWYLSHAVSLLGPVVALERVGAGYRLHDANAYLLAPSGDSLAQIRTSIVHAERTTSGLDRIARAQGLIPPGRIEVSTSTAARRLISLRLDPDGHPLAGDRRGKSWLAGMRSIRRRPGLALRVRVAMLAWFSLTAVAPRPLVKRLAELFLHPDRRGRISRRVATRVVP